MTLRVGFMGTPDFACAALKAIVEAGFDVACVYSQPPRPKGRGQKLQPSPVHDYAQNKNLPVFTPTSLKSAEEKQAFAAHDLDVAIVAAYGLILPKEILGAPRFGCINIHASLLPRWRGASPIQRSIWAGDVETGVSLMQMDEGLDTGPEIMRGVTPLDGSETTPVLHDRLATLGADLVVKALKTLENTLDALPSKAQSPQGVTYAHLLKKDDGRINWAQPALEIDRQIRALNPWPGTFCGEIKIKQASLTDQTSDAQPGTVLDREGHIACGENSVLQVIKVQPPSKQAMDFSAAVNGGYIQIGQTL